LRNQRNGTQSRARATTESRQNDSQTIEPTRAEIAVYPHIRDSPKSFLNDAALNN
jgi:hypothetical protein